MHWMTLTYKKMTFVPSNVCLQLWSISDKNVNFIYEKMLKLDSFICSEWLWSFQNDLERPWPISPCLKEHLLSTTSIFDKRFRIYKLRQTNRWKDRLTQQRQHTPPKFFSSSIKIRILIYKKKKKKEKKRKEKNF
jgi:hypothetical protein